MANYTLIGGDQKEYGPVAEEQLRQWLREGRVNSQSLVKADGDIAWRPISQVPEFADSFRIVTPGPSQAAEPYSQARQLNLRLKLLLCAEALFIICTIATSAISESFLPTQLREYKGSVSAAPHSLMEWMGLALYLALLPAAVVATVGLFLSWKPARPLFLWTRIAVVAIGPLQGISVESGFTVMFDGGAILIAGVIIGMLYYSQLAQLYGGPKQLPPENKGR